MNAHFDEIIAAFGEIDLRIVCAHGSVASPNASAKAA